MLVALALAAACFNETQLFCKGKKGDALAECLAEYADNATDKCRSALGDVASKGGGQQVWSSPSKASGPSVDAALTFSASVVEEAPAAGFEVAVQDVKDEYPVTGRTPSELIAAMGQSGITDGVDGSKGAASTAGELSAKYARKLGDGGCRLTSARLTMKVTQRLPRWDAPADAPAETRAWWEKELGVIRLHEDGHKGIDIDSAHAALSYIQTLSAYPSCEALDQAVSSEIHRANVEGGQKNVAYDAETQHGRTQYAAAFGKP